MASVIELQVTAAPGDGEFTVRVVRSVAGGDSTATMQLDPKYYVDSRDDLETAVLASAVTSRRILSPGEQRLRIVGQQLFDALFSGPVGEAYRASADAASARGERLQVVLRLDVPGLAAIPWEAMYDAQNGEYISLTDPLIRHIASADTEPLAIAPPLKVLVLVSSPSGLAALDVEAEREKLSKALAEPIADGRIELSWLMQATWENVQDEMLSGTWHVLHFIGHGDYDQRTDQGVIALVGDDGGIHLVEADRLAGLLNEARPTPRLVVLNSCQSGRSGTQDLFSSTAATLVRRGINAVAAMQFSISDVGATKFARGLYSALASGRSIGDAIGSGRVGLLSTPGSLEWVTPVLYVRGDTSTLFTINGPATPPPVTAAPPSADAVRPRMNKTTLTVIAAVAGAVVIAAVVMVAVFGSPQPDSVSHTESAGPSSSSSVAVPPTTGETTSEAVDADPYVRTLAAAGVDTTLPGGNAELSEYLANSEFTPYPAVAQALLDAIGAQQLGRPVAIDAIVFAYESFTGGAAPNRADLIDVATLKRAVVQEYDSRYGTQTGDFEQLLVHR
ncbi:MAG: CHAT domain-containing protein [Mycobacterium sp.]